MNLLLIYREDFKVVLVRLDDRWVVPRIQTTDPNEIKKYIRDLLGFTIETIGSKHEDIIVAKRVFGEVKDNTKWVDLEDASKPFAKSSQELKMLVEKDVEYSTKKQLLLIEKVLKAFEKEELEIYLCGGWAVDFLAGVVSRPHVDIDTFIWKKDKGRISEIVKNLGFLVKDKGRKFQNSLEGFQFDMDFVEQIESGFVSGKSSDHEGIKWSKETFEKPVTTKFGNVTANVINPQSLYEFLKSKLEYNLKHGKSSGPLEKTRQDILVLEKYLDRQINN